MERPWRTSGEIDLGPSGALPARAEILRHVRGSEGALRSIDVSLRERDGRTVASYEVDVSSTARVATLAALAVGLTAVVTAWLCGGVALTPLSLGGALLLWLAVVYGARVSGVALVHRLLRQSVKAARAAEQQRLPPARAVTRRR